MAAFFESEVFYTLLVMGIFVMPGIWIPMFQWPQQTRTDKQVSVRAILGSWFLAVVVGVVGYVAWVEKFATPSQRLYVRDEDVLQGVTSLFKLDSAVQSRLVADWSHYAPLIGFVVAQVAFIIIGPWPYFLFSSTNARSVIVGKKNK